MVVYKNWKRIAELDDDKNFLKLRLMVEDDQEKLYEFQKKYPELFCDERVNLRISRSSIVEKEKQEYLNNREYLISEYENPEKKKWVEQDNLDNAEYWSKRRWTSLYMLGVPTVNISFRNFDFWLESELNGFIEIVRLIKDSENHIENYIFAGAHKINLFGKEMILVDFDYGIGPEDTVTLALAEHIDMNS